MYKLVPIRRTRVLQKFLSNRVIVTWSSLPNSLLVPAESVNSFKTRLDVFWLMHDIVYDYRTDQLAARSNMQISLTITVI